MSKVDHIVNLNRNSDLVTVATYRRAIGASLERVWENVLDWEHLPWLHSSAFSAIECGEAGGWGWRADVVYPGGSQRSKIELITDRAANRYVTRVLDGPGAGGEVWTALSEQDPHTTDIVVEFCLEVPEGVEPEAVGAGYLALYRVLWDEDEEMMQTRQSELDRIGARELRKSVKRELGKLDDLRASLPLDLELPGGRFRILEADGGLRIHSLVCPHSLGPLEPCEDDPCQLQCPWHGYRFDLRSGSSCDGRGLRLFPAPELTVDPETHDVRLQF
jgi:nitrite reductase/ring-hydroxylating ferredoxin subunit